MAGNTFGTLFRVTTWGESHGKAIGAVVDGCPAGLPLCEADLQTYLDRRKPGQNKFTTARKEADEVEILSGVFEGKTTGTPILLLVWNKDQRSKDYQEIASYFRPGHADYTYDQKYGFRDYRGGGRSSARETIGRVAAGAIACRILQTLGIEVTAYTKSIGKITCDPAKFDLSYLPESRLCMPDKEAEEKASSLLEQCMADQTSCGGVVECVVRHLPAGLGEPVFDKLDALLGQALFSIGAVKAVEIGDGLAVSHTKGHENNDQYEETPQGARPLSNHAGGILGGISNGNDLIVRAAFKPTPSISRTQSALFADGSVHEVNIRGRHDPIVVPRAVVVVESMTALTLVDLLLRNLSSKMDNLKKIYE